MHQDGRTVAEVQRLDVEDGVPGGGITQDRMLQAGWQSYERRTLGAGGSSNDFNDHGKDGGSAGQAQEPGPPSKDPKANKHKSELDKWWAAALATKKEFSAVAMAGDRVIQRSNERTSKSWATLSTDIDLLKDALASLRKGLGSFGSDFVMKDSKQARKVWKSDDAGLTTACRLLLKFALLTFHVRRVA